MALRKISCPRCGKPSLFTPENPYRPFCSERCKLIDLGNWADGRYAIPVGSASGAGSDETPEDEHDEKISTMRDAADDDSDSQSGFEDDERRRH